MARNGEWIYESEMGTPPDISGEKEKRNTKDAWSGVVQGRGFERQGSFTDGNWVCERIQNGRLAGGIHFNIFLDFYLHCFAYEAMKVYGGLLCSEIANMCPVCAQMRRRMTFMSLALSRSRWRRAHSASGRPATRAAFEDEAGVLQGPRRSICQVFARSEVKLGEKLECWKPG